MQKNGDENKEPERRTNVGCARYRNAINECVQQQSRESRHAHCLGDLVHFLAKMEMRNERVLSEMHQKKSEQNERCRGSAVLLDRFGGQVEQRNREHESRGQRDKSLQGRQAPPRARGDRGCPGDVCRGREKNVRDRQAAHGWLSESRSAAAEIAADNVGAGARSHPFDRHERSASAALSSSPRP